MDPFGVRIAQTGPNCLRNARDLSFFRPLVYTGSSMSMLLFCQCGSDRNDISTWNGNRARIHCYTCNRESWLDGFTISEFDPAKLFTAAILDQARKHRKRPPEEVKRIERDRQTAR